MKSMKMIKRAQRGFTLIELMIVVAIIGILAAVAIPQYQDYTIRAKLANAVTALDPIKNALGDTFQSTGIFPNDAAGLTTATGVTFTPTKEVTGITIVGSATTVKITVALAALGTNVPAGATFDLDTTPVAGGTALKWAATVPAGSTLTNTAAIAYVKNKVNGS